MAYLQERENITRQVKVYRYIDGFDEIIRGTLATIIGFYILCLNWLLNLDSSQIIFMLYGIFASSVTMMVAVFLLNKYLLKKREQVTSQHTGFVDFELPKNDPRKKRINILIFVLVGSSGLVANILNSVTHSGYWLYFLCLVLIIPIIIAINARRVGVRRWYLLSAIALVLGVGLYIFTLQDETMSNYLTAIAIYGLGLGITLLAQGVFTLRRYLWDYPVVK